MKLLILSAVLAFAVSIDAATNCHWGPSYWCKSKETAEDCQQTVYCEDNVWKGSAVSMEKGQVGNVQCTICQIVVQVVDQQLKDNSTEEEVKAALDKVCADTGGLAGTCKDLVDQYFPQIWQALVNKLNPDDVCSSLGLCTSSTRNKLQSYGLKKKTKGDAVAMKKGRQVGSTECTICQLVVELAKNEFLNNKTEQEIQQALENLCDSLGALAGTCKDLVDTYFPDIWQEIINGATPQAICTDVGLCNSISLKFSSYLEKNPKLGSLECDACKEVAKEMVGLINSSASEEATKEALLLACNYMGGFALVCRSLVKREWPEIYANIVKIIDQPDQLCVLLKLCSSQKALMAPQATACDLCKLATNFLKPYVDSNSTEAEVKSAIESVCKLLPGSIGDECTSLIDENFDSFWDLLKQEVDTALICVQLRLCNSTKTVQLVKKTKLAPQATLCDVCKMVTNFLKPYVDSNSTETEVKDALEKFCGLLPGSLSDQCTSLIDQNFNMIWQLLQEEIDTGVICVQLQLCKATRTMQLEKRVKMVPQATPCDVCKLVVNFLKPYVDSNSTEAEVKSALDGVCGLLPGDAGTKCTSIVDEYFDMIWTLLKDDIDSGEVCKQLGLCNSTMGMLMKKIKISPKAFTCELCQLVSGELKTLMAKNNSEEEIQSTLKKMCSVIPGSLGGNCTMYVNEYFMLGWVVMKQLVDAGTFCGYVKMCNSSSSVMYLKDTRQGGDECSMCKVVVETVKNIFDDQKTMEETEKLMEQVCPYIPGFSTQCREIIEMYLPQIWKFLEEKMDPTQICTELKLCGSLATIQLAAKPKPVKGVVECLICTEVMKELVSLLDKNATMQEIEAALDKVCDMIPKYGNECKSLVNEYAGKIIDLILSGVAPREICKLLSLCTSVQRQQQLESASGIDCTICKEVLTVAKVAIGAKTTEDEVAKVLEKVCNLVSPGVKSECKSFISAFGPELIQLLVKAIEPDVICKDIKLCTTSSVMEQFGKTRKY